MGKEVVPCVIGKHALHEYIHSLLFHPITIDDLDTV